MEKKCLLILILSVLCWSCSEVIEVPSPPRDPELVLFATMDQHKVDVFVTETTGRQEPDLRDGVDDAIVKIEAPDGNVFRIPNIQDGYYYLNFIPESGEQYTLTAEKTGFETVWSTAVLPPPVDILSLDVKLLDSIRLDSQRIRLFYQFDVHIEEQNDDIEFYEVSSVFPAKVLYDSVIRDGVSTPDILPVQNANTIELYYEGAFFVSDVDSNKISFGAAFDLSTIEYLTKAQIEVKSSNAENYEYANSLSNLRSYNDGELITVNPVELYSNVENGKGFFSGVQTDTISKRIPR